MFLVSYLFSYFKQLAVYCCLGINLFVRLAGDRHCHCFTTKTLVSKMEDFLHMLNALPNPDLDHYFLEKLRELPPYRRPFNYNSTPQVILSDSLIDELENKLKLSEDDTKRQHKNDEFEKFYNEVLKSSFEGMLKDRAPMMKTTYPQGTFKMSEQPQQLTARQIEIRSKLPVFKYTEEILKAIDENTFVLIKGETGSGKTTQIPQMILDHCMKRGSYVHIICTQPRRISAVSIAERVAYERNESLGESVGYQIRLENVAPKTTNSVLYCTTGILLRMMVSDPILANVSHVILDEIHERNIDDDLLIGLLQVVVKYNKQLKVLLMSATFGFEEYSKHFSNYKIINVEGTLYPVATFHLEDVLEDLQFNDFMISEMYLQRKHSNFYLTPEGREEMRKIKKFKEMIAVYTNTIGNKYSKKVIETLKNPFTEEINLNLIERLIEHIDTKMEDGAILVFLPGYEKIQSLLDMLYDKVEKAGKNYLIYPVHSMMPTDEQKDIFVKPPRGQRKIILATNIAETSITIDDIVYVINPGKVKVKHYDIKNKIETLEEYWITKASEIQRQGRAGRCQPGICFNLYTKIRAESFDEYPIPEIQRTRMESVIMNLKSLKIHNVKSFLESLVSPPHEETIDNGITFLKKINALDKDEVMTPLGLHLATLPMDPQIGKMLLMATIFECVDPITTIAATLTLKEPFRRSIGKEKEKELESEKLEFAAHTRSDHITYSNVIKQYRKAVQKQNFCKDHCIVRKSVNEIEKMKLQLCDVLTTTGFIKYPLPDHTDINKYSNDENILRAIITAGLYPNLAILRSVSLKNIKHSIEKRVEHIIQTPEDGINVKIHFTSVNRKQTEFDSKFFVYFIKHKSGNNIFLRESTMMSPIPIIIFADNIIINTDECGNYFICVGDNIFRFPSNSRTANILMRLRNRFEKVLEKLAINPTAISELTDNDNNVVDALKILFKQDYC